MNRFATSAMKKIHCPRCEDEWFLESLHHVKGMTYEEAYHRFMNGYLTGGIQRIGCEVLDTTHLERKEGY